MFAAIRKERCQIMKSLGMVRSIDTLGRIVLPIELRRSLDISAGDGIEMFAGEDSIILKKYAPCCIFCGEADGIIDYKGKKVCKKCLKDLAEH